MAPTGQRLASRARVRRKFVGKQISGADRDWAYGSRRRRDGCPHLRRRAPPALPGGGQPARARRGRVAARLLHQRRRRAHRDQHVRREPAQARAALPRERLRADQLHRRKLARNARETTGRDVFIAGSIGPLGEVATSRVRREEFAEQAQILEGRGADLFMVETFYDLDELCDAVEAVRGGLHLSRSSRS